ncbi:MAG TPA: DNA polymerase IV [Deltaproteobacteria bacterium]|nr:DNA polymerase IV [Deltaproteobacteria bacterium]
MQRMRKIIHIDMDAFYASIEQRDRPELKGRPVIVGGRPGERGVVAACSYEARRYGIHSAMSSSLAKRLCPQAVFLPPRFEAYTEASEQIRAIFHEYTDLVEPLSLDEAYLDVTVNKKGLSSASQAAREILERIKAVTGLSASAGVSYNKFLAKVASDFRKPGGLTVITPEKATAFIDALPVGKFFGVGKVTARRMLELGIRTGADLKRFGEEGLIRCFGRSGSFFYHMAHGEDPRPVEPEWVRKSYGRETTLREDITDRSKMLEILEELACDVAATLKVDGALGRTITLKLKYFDFTSITRSITLPAPTDDAAEIMLHIPGLLDRTEAGQRAVRLLGLAVSGLGGEEGNPRAWQLKLPFS